MTIEYRYKIWRNIFMLCEPYQWYTIDPKRKDREDFVQAIKDFIQQWGCAEFSNDFTSFRKIDPLNFINEVLSFSDKHPEMNNEAASYGDFYTKSYTTDNIENLKRESIENKAPEGQKTPSDIRVSFSKEDPATTLKTASNQELELG